MEIKINCLRNGIEQGGGTSNRPASLLDAYGTYLYALYKPSDADVAAHPELAEKPLGIVFPTGNLIKKGCCTYEIQFDNDRVIANSSIVIEQLRGVFKPHMYRYLASPKNNAPDSFKQYLQGMGQFNITATVYKSSDCGIYCAGKKEYDNICPSYPTDDIDNIFLSSVQTLSTEIDALLDNFMMLEKWEDDTVTACTSLYNMPMFIFIKPEVDIADWQDLQTIYNTFFSDDVLTDINKADIEYYKKNAVLIYKKDLMDFKNFFKKMMEYANEINAYSDNLSDQLKNQPQS